MQKAIKKLDKKSTEKQAWELHWEKCKTYIEKAVKYQDGYTIDDIEDKIRQGIFHLWPGKHSAMITEFVVFPQYRALNLLFCGGKYEELAEMLPYIEDFARRAQVKRLYGGGRKGWLRKLKKLGFEPEYMIRKDL